MRHPDKARTAATAQTKRAFVEHMQRCQRACKAGVTAAFADAMTWCHVDRPPPPLWIEIAAHRVVQRRETKAAAKLRLERARHCARCDMVRAACRAGADA